MGLFHHVHKPVFFENPETYFNPSDVEKKKAYERYMFFNALFNAEHDDKGNLLLFDIRDDASKYIEAVVNLEVESRAFKKGTITKEDLMDTDRARKVSHDALITNLSIFNKYVSKKYGWQASGGKVPPGGLFTLDPLYINDRNAIKTWAWFLVASLFKHECNKAKKYNFG